MDTITISKDKLGTVLSDVERLLDHFEDLVEDEQLKQRLNDVKTGRIKGKTETELDEYLEKRGVKVD